MLAGAFVVISQVYPNNLFEEIGFWSIVATVFLVAIFIKSIVEISFFGIFVPLAILYCIYQSPLGLPEISFWTLIFSAILLSIGLHMLFRRKKHIFINNRKMDKYSNSSRSSRDETLTGNRLYARTSFCDSSKYLHSDSLEKGEFIVSFGKMNVYFDQVQLSPDGAEVYLDCSFGELDVYLPRNWQVKDKLQASLGTIENPSRSFTDVSGPQITLNGEARFGTIKIHYV